ncbi:MULTISPECIES: ABC transporter substrate-binding protein [unclassified Corynebacterium]|uniref:ABC transporter substrate-binding protein n=1 Tax=unclassified Corynebacterium TaxID=2624378 RepID=UPI001C48A4CD|nr:MULTISPECIES: extracellular solute-binding protein [unclassified Corynebacterium]MBV7282257.1 extracellular solute-binding protein [Corynebacterium sp. TAE3-ERU30]MBV7302396.1 extracellular solute-binding protein [Corynebacterium sp. TAE3-ERU2]
MSEHSRGARRMFVKTACVLASSSLVLTACSGGDDGSSTSAAEGGSSEGGTIEYWHRLPDNAGATKVNDIVAKWNDEHPDMQVKATKFEGDADDSYNKIDAAIKAGTAPCLAQVSYSEMAQQLVAGHVEDIAEYAKQYEDNYQPGAWGGVVLGEGIYGIPQDTGPLVYFYDKAAFEELGIDVPETWEDFTEAAEKAKEEGKYIGVFEPDEAGAIMAGLSAANGAEWFATEDDSWKIDIDGDKTQQVAELWQGLLDDELVANYERWGDDFKAALNGGEIIGTVGAGWEVSLLPEDLPDGAQWGVAQLPVFDGADQMSGPDGGSAISVLKGCENPEGATEFANWFNTQIPELTTQGLLPAAKGDVTTPEDLQKVYGEDNVYETIAEANANMNPNFAFSPTWPVVKQQINTDAGKVGSEGMTLDEVLTNAQKQGVSSLKDAGVSVKE